MPQSTTCCEQLRVSFRGHGLSSFPLLMNPFLILWALHLTWDLTRPDDMRFLYTCMGQGRCLEQTRARRSTSTLVVLHQNLR
ncbi:hypothetical protein CY34DRAFT_480791 [Suillus luteus UH-Slu-Lm8-n1]|uniref:Uncharacterized protein n=1 Tax=Suillus luteus UH-Slu-Lm8-n1 TaxID=930992 RepID=A0A0D0A6Z0_9AGAM|nr:hypothetical protein CY34DRAFT_480791 [Suillus luteus UH-Slu-Lm8-n1]